MMSSTSDQRLPPPKSRLSSLDLRSTDLVSRFLAATPPYLYNMAILPNTYFFSELLRSFVETKSSDTIINSYPHERRAKKHVHSTSLKSEVPQTQKPLLASDPSISNEWEAKNIMHPDLKFAADKPETDISLQRGAKDNKPTASFSEVSDLSRGAPASSSVWYPPGYPYIFDPLHFCIDLRLSGHFYDRSMQENLQKSSHLKPINIFDRDAQMQFKHQKHSSAFSVPKPTERSNFFAYQSNNSVTELEVQNSNDIKIQRSISINYVSKNIVNIYNRIAASQNEKEQENNVDVEGNQDDNENEESKEKKVKDLRALIGLELVVDYMNHAKPGDKNVSSSVLSNPEVDDSSPTLEVVAHYQKDEI